MKTVNRGYRLNRPAENPVWLMPAVDPITLCLVPRGEFSGEVDDHFLSGNFVTD